MLVIIIQSRVNNQIALNHTHKLQGDPLFCYNKNNNATTTQTFKLNKVDKIHNNNT